MAVMMAGALAMLGPGRWSLDARLFGWKRIEGTATRTDFERALTAKCFRLNIPRTG